MAPSCCDAGDGGPLRKCQPRLRYWPVSTPPSRAPSSASRVRAAFGRSSVNCGRPTSNEVSGARWMLGREFGRKAHPFLAGRAQVHREPWQHERAVARIAAAMSYKHVPAIFEAAFERDGARVGVPTSCNVTVP